MYGNSSIGPSLRTACRMAPSLCDCRGDACKITEGESICRRRIMTPVCGHGSPIVWHMIVAFAEKDSGLTTDKTWW